MFPEAGSQAVQASSNDYDFDLFTLGGGTAGVRASRLSASLGKHIFHLLHSRVSFSMQNCMQGHGIGYPSHSIPPNIHKEVYAFELSACSR